MLTTILLICVLAIFILVGFCTGAKMGFGRKAIKTGFTFIAIVLAVIAAIPLAKLISSLVTPLVLDAIDTSSLGIEDILAKYGPQLVPMVIAPIIFIVLFLIINLILKIPATIINRIAIGKSDQKVSFGSKLGGMGVGVLAGIVIFIAIFAPIAGFSNLVSDLATTDTQTSENGENVANIPTRIVAEVDMDSLPVAESNPVFKAVGALGGNYLFDTLTTTDIDGVKVTLSKEAKVIISVIDLLPKDEDIEIKDILADSTLIAAIGDKISESKLLSAIGADVMKTASEKFENGEKFLGMDAPDTSSVTGQIIMSVISDPNMQSAENLSQSIKDITTTVAKLADDGVIEKLVNASDSSSMVELLEDEEFVENLVVDIFENEVVSNAILATASTFGSELIEEPIAEEDKEEILDTVDNIFGEVEALETPEEKKEYINGQIDNALQDVALDDSIRNTIKTVVNAYCNLEDTEKAREFANAFMAGLLSGSENN